MLEAVPPGEVDRHGGRMLEVWYRRDRGGGDLLVVTIAAREVDGTADHVGRWEFVLIVAAEAMTREVMRERVEAEAARRAIGRVAWIEEA
jgi:hypothetical protein